MLLKYCRIYLVKIPIHQEAQLHLTTTTADVILNFQQPALDTFLIHQITFTFALSALVIPPLLLLGPAGDHPPDFQLDYLFSIDYSDQNYTCK